MTMKRLALYHLIPMIIALVLSYIILYPRLGILEGQLIPVITDVKIEREETAENGVIVYVSFNKRRNCQYLGINWYKNDVNLLVDLKLGSDRPDYTRSLGFQKAGPWLIHTISEVKGSWAEITYSCHHLWKTIAPFYPME